jgi:hypothetical protein
MEERRHFRELLIHESSGTAIAYGSEQEALVMVYRFLHRQGAAALAQRTGLEEQVAGAMAMTEEAARGGQVVILEAAGLEEFPAIQAVVERLKTLAGQVIVLGRSPAAEELKGGNPRILFASGLEELAGLLLTLRETQGITEATYLGRASAMVEAVVREIGMIFTWGLPSVAGFFAGLGVPGPLAADLAAGLEQVGALAGEA